MYTPYITITLGIVCVFVVPVVYYNYIKNKKTKKIIGNFERQAKDKNLNLDYAESMPNLLIGVDAASRKLFALQGMNAEQEKIVDLKDLVSCEIHTVRKPPSGEITLISLHLSSRSKLNHEIVFYNAGMEVHPDAERRMEAAVKWERIISANIKK